MEKVWSVGCRKYVTFKYIIIYVNFLLAKSLHTFCETSTVPLAIRTSLADYKHHGNLIDVPLWAIETLRAVDPRP